MTRLEPFGGVARLPMVESIGAARKYVKFFSNKT